MPLRGIKVLEFVGLAPGPFCGKILADFGATVTRIDKVAENYFDVLQHGKQTLGMNLKDHRAQDLIRKLSSKYDVLIEPFRPGIMEKLNLGPEILLRENPQLIYARLTGFGQSGRLAKRAGHDINYAALSGVLSMIGRHNEKPTPPINVLADFAGGGLMCAFGICLALLERHNSGRGQIIDASMTEGAAYVASWLFMSRSLPFWQPDERGRSLIDGGSFFYDVYETKDGKFMSVGPLEPQFFETFKTHIGLPQLSQFVANEEDKEEAKTAVETAFLQKTQQEWTEIFQDTDACVYPVLDWKAAPNYEHNIERESFQIKDDIIIPKPAPWLSRTPGAVRLEETNSVTPNDVLKKFGLTENEIQELINEKVLLIPGSVAKL